MTLIPKTDAAAIVRKQSSVGTSAHLMALILASDTYLGTIWDNAKSFDPAYEPIAWRSPRDTETNQRIVSSPPPAMRCRIAMVSTQAAAASRPLLWTSGAERAVACASV